MDYINESKNYKRQVLMRLIDKGESNFEISKLLEYSESWVKQLRKKYEQSGAMSLKLQKPGGSICRLSESDLEDLKTILTRGAQSYGLEGAYWDRKRIKYVIEEEFRVVYDIEHISDIVKRINFTLQVPNKRDYRQNLEKITQWEQETLPAIKKKQKTTQP